VDEPNEDSLFAVSTYEAYWQMQYQKITITKSQEEHQKASFVKLKVRVKEEEIEPKPRIQRSYGNLYEKPDSHGQDLLLLRFYQQCQKLRQ
jgi:hypothetical protein